MTTQELTVYHEPAGGWESDGNEEIAKPRLPMISIVQATTTRAESQNHAGEFYHSDGYHTPVLECVVLQRAERRSLFEESGDAPICRSDDGISPVAEMPLWDGREIVVLRRGDTMVPPGEPKRCTSCVFSEWTGPRDKRVAPPCSLSYVLLVVRDDGSVADFRFKGASIRPYTEWVQKNLAPSQRNPRGLPIFTKKITFSTESKSRAGAKWQELTVTSVPLSQEDAERYNSMRKELGLMATHPAEDDGFDPELPFE